MKYYYFTKDKLYAFTESIVSILKQNYEVEKEFCLEETGYNLLTKFESPKLEVKQDLIVNGKSKIKLINKDLPKLTMNYTNEQKLSIVALKNAFKFVSKSSTRPALTGVAIYKSGVIATDSFKAYLYGKVEKEEKPIVLTPEFVTEVISKPFESCILKSNNHLVCADFENGEVIVGKFMLVSYPTILPLFEKYKSSGNAYENVEEELDKLYEFGKFVGKNLSTGTRVIFKKNTIIVEGEHTFQDTSILDINVCLEYSVFKCGIESLKGKKYTLLYAQNQPIVLEAENEIILLMPMRYTE